MDVLTQRYPLLGKMVAMARHRPLGFTVLVRLVPVIPSAVAALSASFLAVPRRAFYLGTGIAGWVRPVMFAALGASGQLLPIC